MPAQHKKAHAKMRGEQTQREPAPDVTLKPSRTNVRLSHAVVWGAPRSSFARFSREEEGSQAQPRLSGGSARRTNNRRHGSGASAPERVSTGKWRHAGGRRPQERGLPAAARSNRSALAVPYNARAHTLPVPRSATLRQPAETR